MLCCLCVSACASDAPRLVVDLRTDYVAGVEFDTVRVQLGDALASRTFGLGDRDRSAHRITEFQVGSGDHALEVALFAPNGERLLNRHVTASVRSSDVSITVVVSRACEDVACGAAESCLGGRCVPRTCLRGDEPECPMPQCEGDSDCDGAGLSMCARPLCEAGVCLVGGATPCATDEYCDVAAGCVPLPDSGDAGAADAGADAGVADAGVADAASDAQPDAPVEDAGPLGCTPGVDCSIDCTDVDAWPAAWVDQENIALNDMNVHRTDGAACGGAPADPVPVLTLPDTLRVAARCHSQDMAENEFFGHAGSDGSTFPERMEAAGYLGAAVAENVGAARTGGSAMIAGWMESEPHCLNIMREMPRQVGIGFYPRDGSVFGSYWTAVFGAR